MRVYGGREAMLASSGRWKEGSGGPEYGKHRESRTWSETSAKLFWKIIGYSLAVERKGRKKQACHFLYVPQKILP
jgi:hypothetical protein